MTIQPKLPEEIWGKIFEYLNPHEIIKVTNVCRIFRDIVNKSSLLSSRLTLNFEKRKNYGWLGRRRYRKLSVSYVNSAIHYSILKFIGSDITNLEFRYHNFKLDSIRQILLLCENIKVLKFNDIQHLHGTQEVTTCLKIPRYRNIELNVEQCDPRIFKVLKNVQAKKIHITCVEFAHRQYFVDLVEFLGSQEDLVDLSLSDFMGSIVGLGLVLFSNDLLCDVKFRLKKLSLQSNQLIPYGNISSVQFFATFMDLHKETLEELNADMLQDFDFTTYVAECKSLKRISVGIDLKLSSKVVVPQVEKLSTENVRISLLKSFPNLREFQLLNEIYTGDDDIVKWSLLQKCKFLWKIDIMDVSLDDFPSVPTLRSMILRDYINLKSEAFARNPQLEELTFINCNDMSARKSKVLKIIVDYMRNLKSLTIISSSKVNKSAIEYVKNKCTNLKYFNIYKCDDRYEPWI